MFPHANILLPPPTPTPCPSCQLEMYLRLWALLLGAGPGRRGVGLASVENAAAVVRKELPCTPHCAVGGALEHERVRPRRSKNDLDLLYLLEAAEIDHQRGIFLARSRGPDRVEVAVPGVLRVPGVA